MLHFEKENRQKERMQCAHQQPGRGSPELRDGQKATPAGHRRENVSNHF